ncbi:MAG: 3-hydroxyacyl-CoA dehydrogenase family protein [Desulfovibrio sp.]|nr:3-hydroxyacyl-CoA dehydrogenase family protein [Desulfovibrio sp.]
MRIPEIQTVACLGAGTMGHGIAFLAAKAGYTVRLFGRSQQSLDKGMAGVERAIALYEAHQLMPANQGASLKKRIIPVTSVEEAADGADLILESVAEDLHIKQKTFSIAERHCRPEAVLATNTSGLSLSAIGSALARPEYFLSIHFFSPPYLMSPAEISPIPATLPAIRALSARWVKSLGNVPIELEKEVKGFIVNRIQAACLREALHIVEQGWASAETVDKAVSLTLGRRYSVTGPIESADMGGLDIFNSVLEHICPVLGTRVEAGPLMDKALQSGRLGMKSGNGLYAWPPETISARRAAREQSLIGFMQQDMEDKA